MCGAYELQESVRYIVYRKELLEVESRYRLDGLVNHAMGLEYGLIMLLVKMGFSWEKVDELRLVDEKRYKEVDGELERCL